MEPQSIKARPICFQDKARVISHRLYEDMCWGNSSRTFIFCHKKQNGLPKKILVLLQALMVLMMFYCLLHPEHLSISERSGHASHTDFVYILSLHTKADLIALSISGQGWT